MLNFWQRNKKLIWSLFSIMLVSVLAVNWQMKLTRVWADNWPLVVSTKHLDFGLSFPGEERSGEFVVSYADSGLDIPYKIIQKRKPLPPEHPEYPDGGDPDMPGFYRDLCPYLEKISLEGEGDSEGPTGGAMLGPTDTSDSWQVKFSVPAVFGTVSQDHEGGVVAANGEYGCDISIDIDVPECAAGTVLWQIGEAEAGQLDNPADELNYQGFGIFPPFADPFQIGVSQDSDFPWNSNFSVHYADDLDIVFYFNSLVDAAVRLELGWAPGRAGTEEKQVYLDGSSVGNSPVRTGASVAGWWEEMERFTDSFTFVVAPGPHTINLRHLSGDGTVWDYARLRIVECASPP